MTKSLINHILTSNKAHAKLDLRHNLAKVRCKMIQVSAFIESICRRGIQPGATIALEVSEAINETQLDYPEFVHACQGFIGSAGVLIVPTCTPTEGYPKPTFDPLLSPSEMGEFSEFFRQIPGTLRSHNPTHSVAALGNKALEIISGHRSAFGRPTPWGDGALGIGSPWDWLYNNNAWWVLLDKDLDASPFITYVQALYAQRHNGVTRETPFPEFNSLDLAKALIESGIVQHQQVNGRSVLTFETRTAVDVALQNLEDHIHQFNPVADLRNWLEKVAYIQAHGYTQAGVAKVNITPPIPCLRWEGKTMSGVYRDLYARIVVISYEDQQIVLVLCDLLGISRDTVLEIRKRVYELTSLPPSAVMIACTHAHSTPDTVGAGYEDDAYIRYIIEQITLGVQQAYQNSRSVRIGWTKTTLRGIAKSRRKKMVDGKVFTTRYGVPSTWRVKPELIASQGIIDPELTVVRIEDLGGKVLTVIVNFGCHASVALMSANISGDFPGEAMAVLEKVLGDTSVALCTNGAAGDVDPTLEMPYWGPRDDRMATHLGTLYAAQVLECLERIKTEDISQIGAAQELLTLGVRQDWVNLLEHEKERMSQEFANGWSFSSVITRTMQERALRTEVQALRINDLVIVGFPGEIFASTGLRLKAETSGRPLMVLELANDDIGYIPPCDAFAEGGYETAKNLWGRANLDSVDRLLAAAHRAIKKVSYLEAV